MRIAYLAKHNSGGNDDEGSIADALDRLGHNVSRINERNFDRRELAKLIKGCDFLLFHKWHNPLTLSRITIPKVFWYFDLVDYPDPTLRRRCLQRVRWMSSILPLVDLGFCTDGDWVKRDKTGKLIKLTQGANHRRIGRGDTHKIDYDLLFTGIRKGGGEQRIEFVDFITKKYGSRLRHQVAGCYDQWLANLIASSRIVLAPEGPTTDRYWSNRVYNALGYGAFMLHPYCEELTKHYTDRQEIVYYQDYEHLEHLIEFYLNRPREREGISEAGMVRTQREHTYLQRCGEMLQIIQQRLSSRTVRTRLDKKILPINSKPKLVTRSQNKLIKEVKPKPERRTNTDLVPKKSKSKKSKKKKPMWVNLNPDTSKKDSKE